MQDDMRKKTVVLGVTGCIAAYKACEIVRGLQKAGLRVKVCMTRHATEFVGPLSFRALTGEAVGVDMFGDSPDPIPHISLAQEADLLLVAPCTANLMAKLACGIADDLLSSTALACTAPVLLAPAMNVHMYENAATQHNMKQLRERGVRFVEAQEGYLACGEVGRGRLAAVDDIVSVACAILDMPDVAEGADAPADVAKGADAPNDVTVGTAAPNDFTGRRIMVTAGPTVEPLDPVRFLSNHSSGKMGYAVAEAAARRGAQVTLVSGPVSLDVPAGVQVVRVTTACEMFDAAQAAFEDADAGIFAAAVADMRPKNPAPRKLKKGEADELLSRLELVKNPDILAALAAQKGSRVAVGFAAETDNVLVYAQRKLAAKNADFIVANEVGATKTFGADSNKAWLVDAQGVQELPYMPKRRLADVILDKVLEYLN